jgi:H+-translocating NAD(P) transhydrogenase subunit alpha
MRIGIPRETLEREGRVAALPEAVGEYVKMGFDVFVEASAGLKAFRTDDEYVEAGAKIVGETEVLFSQADIILKVKQPVFNAQVGKHEVDMMREGAVLITFLHPASPSNHAMIRMLRDRKITSFTMDGIPREESYAQKMDALTSMSTVTGYKSVLIAANNFPKFIPIIGTAIGTIMPAKFLVIGAGVVGLQAIATAKRLGGAVTAVDIREDARKAAISLGVKVPEFEVPAELTVAEGGYAKALSAEWLEKERAFLAPLIEEADIVIASALVPGEVSPILIEDETISRMKPGSVIVDVGIDQGGNCAATIGGENTTKHGVWICGTLNIPGSVPVHASWLYERNMLEFVKNLFKNGIDTPEWNDKVVKHSLVTHEGTILYQGALKAMNAA